jgi:Fe-S oxidoreductase
MRYGYTEKEAEMAEEKKFGAEKKAAEFLACERRFTEQIEDIRRYGNHGASPVLRAGILAAHGIPKPKDRAENGIVFGCYRPFTTPFLLRDYISLLDSLAIDYTYFEKEFCCGLPLLMQSAGEDVGNCLTLGAEFDRLNLGLAHRKGVNTLAYCCVGCAYMAKSYGDEENVRKTYILDVILDELDKRRMKKVPTVIGYFEGCHTFYKNHFPEVSLEWDRYRRFLDGISGLKIVDLSNKLCCKRSADKILESAEKHNLDKILCSCNGCHRSLDTAANGKLTIMNMPEFLLQALKQN